MFSQKVKNRLAIILVAFFMISLFSPFMRVEAAENDKIDSAYQKLKSLKNHYKQISMRQQDLVTRGNPRDQRCVIAQKAMVRLKNEINRYTRIIQGLEEEAANQNEPTPDDLINDTADNSDQIDVSTAINTDDFSISDQADTNALTVADAVDDKTDTNIDLSTIEITPPPAAPDFITNLNSDDIVDTSKISTDNIADDTPLNNVVVTKTDDIPADSIADSIGDSIDDIYEPDIDANVTVSDVTANPSESGDFIMVVSPDEPLRLAADPNIAEAAGFVENGAILQILEQQGDWIKVCYAPGKTGWIEKDTLAAQTDADAVGTPPAAAPSILIPETTTADTSATTTDDTNSIATTDTTNSSADDSSTDQNFSDDTADDIIVSDNKSDGTNNDTSNTLESSFETYSEKEVVVKVPQRTQYDPINGNYQGSWCGPTSLAMIFDYYGIHKTTAEVAENTYNFEERNGTPSNKLVTEAKENGFDNSRVETGKDLDFLENSCRAGKPVIVNVDVAWSSGHYMVVVGMTDDKIIVNDPGRQEVRREFDKEWFMTQWEGRSKRVIVIE